MFSNKRIFYINSRNRISGTHSDFRYKLDMADITPNKVVVLQANIPKSYYVVESGENTFTLTEGGGNLTVTLPAASYNRINLKVALKTALEAAGAFTYTITSSSTSTEGDTGFLTFAVSGNGGVQPTFTFSGYLWEQLGFEDSTTYTFSGDSLVSPNVIKLIKEDSIFIHSDICYGSTNDNILQEIFASSNPDYTNIVFANHSVDHYSKNMVTNNANVFQFSLQNEDGGAINLNGQNWNMTICVYKQENRLLDFLKGAVKLFV